MAQPRETAKIWYAEANSDDYVVHMTLNKILFEDQSEFQKVQVIETAQFGKTLILDGKTQSSLLDEFMYHECLVQPAMLLHPCPKRVYIGGGGELATAREVLKHSCVEKCIMVDLDKTVVEICKEHLPEWSDGCTEDPRLEIVYDDAHSYLMNHGQEKFDVIIMDIADPIEAGPGIVLYTHEFYNFAKTMLNPNGVFVTQSGSCSLYNFEECFTSIHNTLKTSFDHVKAYRVDIPSFAGMWGYNIAYNKIEDQPDRDDYDNCEPVEIDRKISERFGGKEILRFYDGITHRGLFGLPKPIRKGMENEKRVITVANPVFMY